MAKIILLDGNSLINRAYYAIGHMTTKDGVPTNAVYGFMSMLNKLINENKPTHMAAIFDMKAPTFRHKMYEGYKCTRKGMPDDLAAQLPLLKDLLGKMKVKILQLEGYEADDIIGTMAKRLDYDTIIVSGDRDVFQLIDDNTIVFNTRRGVTNIDVVDLEALKGLGFQSPSEVIEYKALAGDSSDCIPGVAGVGEVTAMKLLAEYGNIDNIYQNIGRITGKLRERLEISKDDAYMSRILATIDTNVPIECTLDDLSFTNSFDDEFFSFLESLEFKSLTQRFVRNSPLVHTLNQEKESLEGEDELDTEATEIKLTRLVDIEKMAQDVLKSDKVAINLGEKISVCFDGTTEYTWQTTDDTSFFSMGDGIGFSDSIAVLKPIFESGIKKLVFDVKGVMHTLVKENVKLSQPYEDILLLSYLIDSGKVAKDVNDLLSQTNQKYAGVGIYRAYVKALKDLNRLELVSLYYDIELPLTKVLFDMEREGFIIDIEMLMKLSKQYEKEIESENQQICQIAGLNFNVNSVKQLADVLYNKLGLSKGKKIKTGYSVDADTLSELEHPIIPHILRYRQIVKLQSTYLQGFLRLIDREDGKIHTSFKQCATVTGRLSSAEPNLQNIPIKTDEGREIRKMFIASKGNVLIYADYSQIELRLLAHFSNDPVLIDAYKEGRDIHTLTASKIFGLPENMVTKSMRRSAKAVNFGIIYGMSAFGLASNIGVSASKAKEFQLKYFENYPNIKAYMQENVEFARQNGYIRTIKGRIRHFPELSSSNRNIRNFGERAAMNMPLQGTASDIVKIAMLRAYEGLKAKGLKAKLILQVHDELVLDCPIDEAEAASRILKEAMENAIILKVPLLAEVKSGFSWYVTE